MFLSFITVMDRVRTRATFSLSKETKETLGKVGNVWMLSPSPFASNSPTLWVA